MPNAVEVSGLRKSYGQVHAVRDVGFTVGYGEIVALLGPNGAGKTTTLEILEGFRTRDGGTAEVLGYDPGERSSARELRERIGLVLQDIAVEPYLTVRETIARAAGYYRAPRGVAEVIGLVGLTGLERRKVRSLSGGQKRRLDLALGLIGNPALLYLDEPTTGFDPAARRDAWQLVRGLRTAGMTILLTTHDMDEAQALADRVVLLSGGVVVAAGEPAALGGRDAERTRISFRLPAGYTAADLPVSAHSATGMVVVETDTPTQALHRLTDWAIRRGHVLAGLTVERPSLEDVYLELTREGAPARAPARAMTTAVAARRRAGGPPGPPAGTRSNLRLLAHQVRYEQLSFWRNPQSAVFTFIFPVVFVVIMGALFGGSGKSSYFGGLSALQYYVPTIAALSVLGSCYGQLAVALAARRQAGILKRIRATPLPAWAYFAGLLAHCVLVSVIDIALIVVVGRLYGVPFPSHWLAITLTLVLGAASFCALGVAVASVISNAEAAPAVAQLVLFPLTFISGTYGPIHSALLNHVCGWLPVRPFNEALTGPFAQHAGADWRDLAVLAAWGVVGAGVAVRRFRWDPRPE